MSTSTIAKRARESCNLISGTVQGYYAGADGSIDSSDTHWCRSELISCKGSTSYVCTVTIAKTSRWVAASFYDIDMNYLGSVDTKPDPPIANVTLSFTTPATAVYMGLSFAATYYYTTLKPSEITNLMLNEGSTALPYEPYGIVGFYEGCEIKRYYKSKNQIKNESEQGTDYLPNLLYKNNFDADTIDVQWAFITEMVPVESSKKYTLFTNLCRTLAYGNYSLKFFDSKRTYIGTANLTNYASLSEKTYSDANADVITTPSTCAYIRLAVDREATMVYFGAGETLPDRYEPYDSEVWHGTSVYVRRGSKNIADPVDITQGYYAYADGSFVSIDTQICILVPVQPNTDYTASFASQLGTSCWYGYVWFDANMNYLSTNNTQTDPTGCTLTATSPANAAYVAFNIAAATQAGYIYPSDIDWLMISKSSSRIPYEPYGQDVWILPSS